MTFKKNLYVTLICVVAVFIGALVVGLPREHIAYGTAFMIAAAALVLLVNDVITKKTVEHQKLNWEYSLGVFIAAMAIIPYLWAVGAVTNLDFVVRLGLTVFLGGMGCVWFYKPYKASLEPIEVRFRTIG